MAPQYDPKTLFRVVDTAVENDCFFCTEKIDPTVHFEHFVFQIPDKPNYRLHADCFEQLQWSMLNFYVNSYIKKPKETIVH